MYRGDALKNKCEVRKESSDLVELFCDIGELYKEDIINVVIPFFVPPGKLGKYFCLFTQSATNILNTVKVPRIWGRKVYGQNLTNNSSGIGI